MAIYSDHLDDAVLRLIKDGGIGVLRTDTLYGIVARADNEQAVARVYDVKRRTPSKSPIVLIGSLGHLFETYDQSVYDRLGEYWPGKNSIILPSRSPAWIVRDNASIAYRVPADPRLRKFLLKTGPLIAPSANPEGLPPAATISDAQAYFKDTVDFYSDGGVVENNTPSRLYKFSENSFERLR